METLLAQVFICLKPFQLSSFTASINKSVSGFFDILIGYRDIRI